MQEVLLQFQSKVSRLEKDKENCLESPSKADKVNRALHAENVGLKSKIKVLTSSNEEQSAEINVLQNNLTQAQSELTNLQSGLKMRLNQSEASNEALQKQITHLLNEMEEKEKIINNHENKSKSLVKDLEQINEKLSEKDREHQMKISAFEVSKAKEISTLKTELSLMKQNMSSQALTVESLEAELSKIGEKHSTELRGKEEDLAEAKVEIEDSLQRLEDRSAELLEKNKEFSLHLRDAEEEIDRLKKERSRILRDFDEDMARISFENEQLRKEVEFLKSRPGGSSTEVPASCPPEAGNSSQLERKCGKYKKLIHKLRDKMSVVLADKERLEGELDGLREKHKQFSAVFSQLEETERLKVEKMTKIEEVKLALAEMTAGSEQLQ